MGSLWAAGTALLLLWLATCQRHLSRIRRSARPLTTGPAADTLAALTPRPPALLTHPCVRSPFLVGIRRPAIFLPTTYEADFDPTALRAILAHELAHLERRDNAWTLAARLLSALLWPQPLLWALCRHLEQTGEEACDLAVLAQDCPPHAYAACLLTLAERHPLGRRERALGAGVAPFRSSLGQRIGRILDKGTRTMSIVSTRLRLTVAAFTVAAALGGAFLISSAPAQVSAASASAMTQTSPSLVGTWLCRHDDGTSDVLIFSSRGRFESIGPWPGESRVVDHSYDSNEAISHSYGPYSIRGPKLTYTDTRVWVEGGKPWKTDPYKHAMEYTLTGDLLTLRLRGKWVNLYHRVPAYTKAMIVVKANAAHPDSELSEARFLAGLTPVQGPGVVVTLNDSQKKLPQMPPGFAAPNLIHDTDINQVVNELRAAGAEAIAVNDQRLVATSSVRTAGPTILINFTPTVPPYIIKAIGNSKTLASAMNLPGGIATQIKAYDPAMFSVNEMRTMTLPAYSGGGTPRYAKPVPMASAGATPQHKANVHLLESLMQEREQRQAQLSALKVRAEALSAQTQIMRKQAEQTRRKLTGDNSSAGDLAQARRQTLILEITATQASVDRMGDTMASHHPAVVMAERKLHLLKREYQELPIWEKQQFVKSVHEYSRRQILLGKTLPNASEEALRQRNGLQRQQRQLEVMITMLNTQITRKAGPKHWGLSVLSLGRRG